jgi:hypothetical protein
MGFPQQTRPQKWLYDCMKGKRNVHIQVQVLSCKLGHVDLVEGDFVFTLVSARNVLLFLEIRDCENHPLVQNVGKVHLIVSSGQQQHL